MCPIKGSIKKFQDIKFFNLEKLFSWVKDDIFDLAEDFLPSTWIGQHTCKPNGDFAREMFTKLNRKCFAKKKKGPVKLKGILLKIYKN